MLVKAKPIPTTVTMVVEGDTYSRYQVMANKTIRGLNGKRFIVSGVCMPYNLFCSFNVRADYNYRINLGSGISSPTYNAKYYYQTAAWRDSEYQMMRDAGINFMRICVEPAVMNASVSYVDPVNGLTYPSDPVMLDTFIDEAAIYGIVVQLITANDYVGNALNITFMVWLAARYANRKNVWLAPFNEPLGMSDVAHVSSLAYWKAKMDGHTVPMRAAGFTNPICIDPPGYSVRVDLITSWLSSSAEYANDPNLLLNVHYYPVLTQSAFRPTYNGALGNVLTTWGNYANTHCLVANEIGHSYDGNRYDPNLDPAIPSANLTYWTNIQSNMKDFLDWLDGFADASAFSGGSAQMWGAYFPSLSKHDDNSLRTLNTTTFAFNAWTTWGNIFKGYYASRYATNQVYPLT